MCTREVVYKDAYTLKACSSRCWLGGFYRSSLPHSSSTWSEKGVDVARQHCSPSTGYAPHVRA